MNFFEDILTQLGLLQQVPVQLASQILPYVGMDQGRYFGLPLLNYFQQHTNVVWVAGYLDSPALFPGEITPPPPPPRTGVGVFAGHNRTGSPRGTWMDGLQEARGASWGVLPIYWGEQDPRNADGPWDLRTVAATNNAQDAIAKCISANLDPHIVLYLDFESAGAPSASAIAYIKTWFELVAEAGIRPGLYAHGATLVALRNEWPEIAGWITNPWVTANQTIALPVTGTQAQFRARSPTQSGPGADRDAVAWQMWFSSMSNWPATLVLPAPTAPATFPINFPNATQAINALGHPVLGLDVSSSSVADPAFPERRCAPGLVRRGRKAAAVLDATTVSIFSVRRGVLRAATWSAAAAPGTTAPLALPDPVMAYNPWACHKAVTRGTLGDLAIVARSATIGTADNAWQLCAFRRRNATWTTDQAINGNTPIELLFGVGLVSRAADTVEAFFATNDGTGRIFVASCVDAPAQANNQPWSAPVVVNAPAGLQVSFLGGIAGVSRAAGTADVFIVARAAVAQPWQLFWNSSSILGTWLNFSVPGDPTVVVHPFSNVAVVSRGAQLVDAFAFAKGAADTNWTLYWWWWNQAEGWGSAPPGGSYHTSPVVGIAGSIGGTAVRPHPVSKLAAVSRDQQSIDVFIVGYDDGLLYNATWDGTTNTWSDFSRVGTTAIRVASVDVALTRAPNMVDVVVTGRDGNVYIASLNAALTGFSDLTRLAAFDIS